jgi:hypothetical protein
MPAIGERFGRLEVLSTYIDNRRKRMAMCKCDCGNTKAVMVILLRCGDTKSCGCYCKDKNSAMRMVHGHCTRALVTKEYNAWLSMLGRTKSKRDKWFKDYVSRGITVCERWKHFENFLTDMGEAPSKAHSLDRVNNDGNYEPSNCRWATLMEQANNKRFKTGGSGVRGVWPTAYGKFKAVVRKCGTRIRLGTFKSIQEAELAIQDWKRLERESEPIT